MDDLKPVRCGCGGEAVVVKHTFHGASPSYGVECMNCHVETWQFYNEEAEAITAWNRAMRTSAEPERKKGEWIERKVYSMTIMDYQHAKCSVCGKYLTTPYQYFFDNYPFCPNCGAEMRGE